MITRPLLTSIGVFYLSDVSGIFLVGTSNNGASFPISLGPLGTPVPLQLIFQQNSSDCAIKLLDSASNAGIGRFLLIQKTLSLTTQVFVSAAFPPTALFSFELQTINDMDYYRIYSSSINGYLSLGMSKNAAVSKSTSLADATPLLLNPAWKSQGCWSDLGKGIQKPTWIITGSNMSLSDCHAKCAGIKGVTFAGFNLKAAAATDGGSGTGACYCSYAFTLSSAGVTFQPNTNCSIADCPASLSPFCGNSTYSVLETYINTSPSMTWNYMNCFQNDSGWNFDVTSTKASIANQLTNDNCVSACSSGNNNLFSGTYNGNQCICANAFPSADAKILNIGSCASACPGDSKERCGGVGGSISLYSSPQLRTAFINTGGVLYLGCWRVFSGLNTVSYTDSNSMTTTDCISFCASQKQSSLALRYVFLSNDGTCYCSACKKNEIL